MTFLRQVSEYRKLTEEMQEKIDELKSFKDQYIESSRQVIEKDAEIENYKRSTEITREALEQLTKENKHLWALLVIKGQEVS